MSEIKRCCDLVMKGGVTSGVVYPSAIHEIAKSFYLVGIGGTSAGAMAACLAAAAEYRRRTSVHGSLEGFERLEQLAKELGQEGRMLELFQPDRRTRKRFKELLPLIQGQATWWTYSRLGAKLAIAWGRNRWLRPIIENDFGLTTGMAVDNPPKSGKLPLTAWLAREIQIVAGRDPEGEPLTFKDLHDAPVPASLVGVLGQLHKRSIDLRCVTTCLTFGRPLEFPLREKFAFDPAEWATLFPPFVLEYLRRTAAGIDTETRRQDGKLPLPQDELPLIVAARMSLSFPGLFTMVPMWTSYFDGGKNPLHRVWCSDGGITSNFPMHRFDSVLPSWPTLGLALQYEPEEGAGPQRSSLRQGDEWEWVYLPRNRHDGVLDLWNEFDLPETKNASARMAGLASAIFRSAQIWHDNAYLKFPGFRDRSAEIWFGKKEGGMNLKPEEGTVDKLIERGREAGRRLVERFAETAPVDAMSWRGHRWVRFRSAMAGLMELLHHLHDASQRNLPGDDTLAQLLAEVHLQSTSKFHSKSQRQNAQTMVQDLLRLIEKVDKLPGAPGLAGPHFLTHPFHKGPNPAVKVGTKPQI